MGYVFISYSSKNQDVADAFRQMLRKNGIENWMAPYDIPVGSEYAEVLYDALTGCSCLVLLLTGVSQNSQWVKKEVNIAISNCKPIIPVKLEEVELNSAMKLYLNDQQIVLVRTLDEASESVKGVLKRIVALAGQTNVPQGASTTPSAQTKTVARLEFSNGVYEGEVADGKRAGKGKYTWPDGEVYEGDYVDDKRHGKGKYTYASGEVYEGDFVDGNFHGKGKYTFASGNVYEGDFVNGRMTGKGKKTYTTGDVYEGDFANGCITGKGRYTYAEGDVYEGDFVDGKFHGKGRYTDVNGDVCEGNFADGNFIG